VQQGECQIVLKINSPFLKPLYLFLSNSISSKKSTVYQFREIMLQNLKSLVE